MGDLNKNVGFNGATNLFIETMFGLLGSSESREAMCPHPYLSIHTYLPISIAIFLDMMIPRDYENFNFTIYTIKGVLSI